MAVPKPTPVSSMDTGTASSAPKSCAARAAIRFAAAVTTFGRPREQAMAISLRQPLSTRKMDMVTRKTTTTKKGTRNISYWRMLWPSFSALRINSSSSI